MSISLYIDEMMRRNEGQSDTLHSICWKRKETKKTRLRDGATYQPFYIKEWLKVWNYQESKNYNNKSERKGLSNHEVSAVIHHISNDSLTTGKELYGFFVLANNSTQEKSFYRMFVKSRFFSSFFLNLQISMPVESKRSETLQTCKIRITLQEQRPFKLHRIWVQWDSSSERNASLTNIIWP